jgi:hypothetical protein
VLQHRLSLFKKHLNETYFAWIGDFGDDDPYYYRIHSPVAFMELDFHCGSKLRVELTLDLLTCYSIFNKHKSC